MNKSLYSTIALYLIPVAVLAQQDWIPVAETEKSTWHVKPGSLEIAKTKGQVDIVAVVGRFANKSTSKIDLHKWYVAVSDCQRQMGKVVTLNIDGTFAFENDFVFGSGSVASGLAEAICGAHAFQIKSREDKGI
jgi:hypothetical protein